MVTKLRLARVKTDLTLRQFSRQHGFSEIVLCRIERGQSYVPPAWREKLAEALDREPDQLWDPVTGWPRLTK